jgi:peroxiredoxin
MIYKLLLALFFVLFSLFNDVKAQTRFKVNIEFLLSINTKNIHIYYDNGRGLNVAKFDYKKRKAIVSDDLYAKYATIRVEYGDESVNLTNFWVSDKVATIVFDSKNDSLTIHQLQNAYELKNLGEQKLNDFIANENNELSDFLIRNKNWQDSSALVALFWKKKFKIEDRKIEFVKQNPSLYYSFSLFRREIVHFHVNIDSLIKTYDTVFSDSIKHSLEGAEITKILNSRNLKKGGQAPDFLTKDFKGNNISLKDYKGEYTLLTFWSTSCKPCIEEFPAILEIKNQYSPHKLNIISISTDTDFKVFSKAIKKYNMTWINVFGNIDELVKIYGVQSIPQIYLINKTGKIVYSREEENDNDAKLLILSKVLKESIPTP